MELVVWVLGVMIEVCVIYLINGKWDFVFEIVIWDFVVFDDVFNCIWLIDGIVGSEMNFLLFICKGFVVLVSVFEDVLG